MRNWLSTERAEICLGRPHEAVKNQPVPIFRIPIGRVKDVVVALVCLIEARFGKRRGGGQEQWKKKDDNKPHGKPPNTRVPHKSILMPDPKS